MTDVEISSKIASEKLARSIVGSSEGRPDKDFYPTPSHAIKAILDRETFIGSIWEPACGTGNICKELVNYGYSSISSDLVDKGYGDFKPHDFLTSTIKADNIITNPPFKLMEKFVELGLERTTKKVILLGKLAFLEGKRRKRMFEETPLESVYVFSYRVQFGREGVEYTNGSMIAFAWFVWNHEYIGLPTIKWI